MIDEMSVVNDFASRLPVDVIGIFDALSIDYVEEPMAPGQSGRIHYEDPFCTVTVNATEGPQRKRFTAAHELGHYLLHRDLLDGKKHLDRLFSDSGRDNPYGPLAPSHEVQANKFAADLLMPAGILRARYDPARDNVTELADLCDVSHAAMEIRLKALGIRP
ncbi:ImmA/IrrE family metallo-endopeptidase [Cognatishimia sp. SS12]|uniref:ImmA/IrrE family metallo-endopeptidase n=1 Tax=Cognatishimia sp. SS12 TaxID=2979465 RepID=UPI00232E0C7A|nr:ImmA/IrrE family metallo-endopeptidase [Cognatishimia sp. SS12]MDC0739342.1 ImmA/IrrE family metallo-endopeptidase [Cognatishimia sp. SS12]